MAHVADCMREDIGLGLNNLIAKGVYTEAHESPESTPTVADRPASRAGRTNEEPKYRLWPTNTNTRSMSISRTITEPERLPTLSTQISSRPEKPFRRMSASPASTKPIVPIHTRRKISIQDLGPMATVQEACMDSPTLPGGPPLRAPPMVPKTRERSSSAPLDATQSTPNLPLQSCKDLSISCCRPQSNQEQGPKSADNVKKIRRQSNQLPLSEPAIRSANLEIHASPPAYEQGHVANLRKSPKSPKSPKFLPPLNIPAYESFGDPFASIGRVSMSFLDTSSNPPSPNRETHPPPVPPKSPRCRSISPPTAKIAMTHMNGSASTLVNNSRSVTPSTPQEGRVSPTHWEDGRNENIVTEQATASETPRSCPQPQSDVRKSTVPITRKEVPKLSSQSIRHSPQKAPSGIRNRISTLVQQSSASVAKREKGTDQASRNLLSTCDVSSFSRELRELDDQFDFYRKSHHSLRQHRRTLRCQMITYLRSPRMATFSRKTILKREEALAELEISIDEVVYKMEQVENRRTRIRQKLLEHIAAGVTPSNKSLAHDTPPHSPDGLQRGIGLRQKKDQQEVDEMSYSASIQALLMDIDRMIVSQGRA